jgi:hypothetical protein
MRHRNLVLVLLLTIQLVSPDVSDDLYNVEIQRGLTACEETIFGEDGDGVDEEECDWCLLLALSLDVLSPGTRGSYPG